jgi:hypothetical protein
MIGLGVVRTGLGDMEVLFNLSKQTGAYTKKNQYKPHINKSTKLSAQFYLIAKHFLMAQGDTDEYRRSTSYLYRR